MKLKHLIIFIIFLGGVFSRLFLISNFPSGFNADEAALGYNAYSLLTTGKDEHGHPIPVNLESFGDFKPALYSYLVVPLVKFFPLNEFTVRLPSVIFGSLATVFIYFLTRLIFPRNNLLALLSATVLSLSPWAIHFSRGAWEVNVATTLILIGIVSFVRWHQTYKLNLLLIFVFAFVLSLYTYQSARVIVPVLGLSVFIAFFPSLKSRLTQISLGGLVGIILLLPLVVSLFQTDASSRLSGVGLLADEGPLNRVKQLRGHHTPPQSLISRSLHNRPVIYTIQFLKNYTDHFHPNFLFINGDLIDRSRIPETGLLYLIDFIFVAVGATFIIRNRSPYSKIIWIWLFVAPLASALTFQTPHALRSHNLVIPLSIIISSGLNQLITKTRFKLLVSVALSLAYLFLVSRFFHQYFIHYPKSLPVAWEYGFKELVSYTESVKNNYDQIWVTDKYDQPYILFLFYSQYPPELFQGNHELTVRDKFNFSTVRDYGKYHFEDTAWAKVSQQQSTLIVAVPEDVPESGVNVIKTIYFPNGQPAFKIISR